MTWKNMLEPDKQKMTIWWTDIACWIPTHTRSINTFCVSTATMVERTRLIVTLYVQCLSFLYNKTN